jgi:Ras-related protein Rab-6A
MTFKEVDYRFKVVLFGNEGVGKTSLVERYVNNRFEEDYVSTLGYNVYEKRVTHENTLIALTVFDIGGQEKFRSLRKKYAEGAHAALIVYDITNRGSFDNVSQWKSDLYEFAGDIPFVIIGNKMDLSPQITKNEGEELSKKLNAAGFFETSAKNNSGIDIAFKQLAVAAHNRYAS